MWSVTVTLQGKKQTNPQEKKVSSGPTMLHCTLRISHVLALFWHTTFDTVHSIPWPRKERIPMSGCTVGIDWYKTYVRVLQAIFLDLGIYGIRVPPLSLLKLIASIKTLSLKNSEPNQQTDTDRYQIPQSDAQSSQPKRFDSLLSFKSIQSNPIQGTTLHYPTLLAGRTTQLKDTFSQNKSGNRKKAL